MRITLGSSPQVRMRRRGWKGNHVDAEQHELFGAGRGDVRKVEIDICTPEEMGFWWARIDVFCTMRRKPMVLSCELYGDQTISEVLGEFVSIANKCAYLKAEQVRHHMWRKRRSLLTKGYDVSIRDCGREPS